ncbi:MAG: hypothetical protein NTZ17_17725 [Phycisphaerae bacterium]|nr:hypothetical protein [Phycisphaerae bacterium]
MNGLLQNGHWAYILGFPNAIGSRLGALQGNLFLDFLEELAYLARYPSVTVWEGKIERQIFPSQSRPNVHFAEVQL